MNDDNVHTVSDIGLTLKTDEDFLPSQPAGEGSLGDTSHITSLQCTTQMSPHLSTLQHIVT